MKRALFVLIIASLFTSCTTTYYVVRHAERLDTSTDSPLSDVGRRRAKDLSDLLANKKIDTIFTTQYIRTQQTAQPLATLLGKNLSIQSKTTKDLLPVLLNIKNKNVLVAGHSDTVPMIVKGLSNETVPNIPVDDFDNMYVVKISRFFGTRRSVQYLTYGLESPSR